MVANCKFFEGLNSLKLISRKIGTTEKSFNVHTVRCKVSDPLIADEKRRVFPAAFAFSLFDAIFRNLKIFCGVFHL